MQTRISQINACSSPGLPSEYETREGKKVMLKHRREKKAAGGTKDFRLSLPSSPLSRYAL